MCWNYRPSEIWVPMCPLHWCLAFWYWAPIYLPSDSSDIGFWHVHLLNLNTPLFISASNILALSFSFLPWYFNASFFSSPPNSTLEIVGLPYSIDPRYNEPSLKFLFNVFPFPFDFPLNDLDYNSSLLYHGWRTRPFYKNAQNYYRYNNSQIGTWNQWRVSIVNLNKFQK